MHKKISNGLEDESVSVSEVVRDGLKVGDIIGVSMESETPISYEFFLSRFYPTL